VTAGTSKHAPDKWHLPAQRAGVRETRLALVMNGGVSLAVWMGGVTAEIDRARTAIGVGASEEGRVIDANGRRLPPPSSPEIGGPKRSGELLYQRLLLLMNSRLRVDVIAGTSAGGINGALLGAAVARRTRIPDVRELWIDLGRFESLLRGALEPDPPSLLKGDGFLLPNLERIFGQVIADSAEQPAVGTFATEAACPSSMSMMITGTDFSGESVTHRDDFGEVIADTEHRALLTFVRDPFTGKDSFTGSEVARQLARAARTSSSFPVAFEPSLCRVIQPGAPRPAPDVVNMQPVASFTTDRWLMDGGVLDNSPFRPVLDAFAGMPANGDVRRVLAYVVPYVSSPPEDADAAAMPRIKAVVGAVVNLPRELSLTDDLIRIEEYRRRSDGRHGARRELRGLRADALFDLAKRMFSTYQQQRARSSVNDLVDRLNSPSATASETGQFVRPAVVPKYLEGLPWVPPADTGDIETASLQRWNWGIRSAERVIRLAIEVIRDSINPDRDPDQDPPPVEPELEPLQVQRGILGELLVDVLSLDAEFFDAVARAVRNEPGAPAVGRILELAAEVFDRPAARSSFRERARSLAFDAASALRVAFASAPSRPEFLNVFSGRPDTDHTWLRRLLAVEVVERAVAGDYEPDVPFDLIRLSAHAKNSFDPQRENPGDKLAGMQLQHFGGFYKSSWRANDWMWGRLDGAARMVDIVLDPDRLRLLYAQSEAAALARYVWAAAGDGLTDLEWDQLLSKCGLENLSVEILTEEFEEVLRGNSDLSQSRKLIRGRFQLDILREELPELAKTIGLDATDGSARPPDTARWLRTWDEKLKSADTLPAGEVIDAFKQSHVGQETIAGEAGSDLLSRTLSTALAVAASAITSKKSGIPGPVRAVLHGVRGVMLAVYLLVRAFTQRSRILRSVAVLVLAGAGTVVAYSLYTAQASDVDVEVHAGPGPPGLLVALAVAIVLAGVVTGLIRAGIFGVITACALALAAIMLVLSPWPSGGLSGIYDRFREQAPTETLVIAFLTISALSSYGGRLAWWPQRLYAWAVRRLVSGSIVPGSPGPAPPAPGPDVPEPPAGPAGPAAPAEGVGDSGRFGKLKRRVVHLLRRARDAARAYWKRESAPSVLGKWIRRAHIVALVVLGLALYAANSEHDLEDLWLAAAAGAGAGSLCILVVRIWRPLDEAGRRLAALRHVGLSAIASGCLLVATISAVPLPRFMTHPPVAWGTLSTTEAYVAWPLAVGLVLVLWLACSLGVAPWLRKRVPELG
jgi:patatin-related protein